MIAALCFTSGVAKADEACRRTLDRRVMACAEPCIARAKAAVDPAIRDHVTGYGCVANCMKLEMFAGHACPAN